MSEILGPPTGYVDLLNYATEEKAKTDFFDKTPIRPSSSGNCSRELYYQLMEQSGRASYPKESNTASTQRLLNLGHSIEYHLLKQLDLLSKVFDLKYKQQVLSFEFLEAKNDPKLSQWLEGSLDVVFWSDKWKCVVDVKSKKDKFHSYYKTAWDETTGKLGAMESVQTISPDSFWVEDLEVFLDELNDPFFASNFLQLNMYANAQFLIERGVNHGAIIQYCKNDSRLREIRFKPSRKLYEKIVAKFQGVITAVDENKPELAPRDYALGSIKCAFCKFKNECWKEDDALKAFFGTFPKKQWPKDTSRMGALGLEIEDLMTEYESYAGCAKDAQQCEQKLVKLALEAGVNKMKLKNGNIYEVKRLKDSIVLRRSKL